jgi:hypothetical protein
MAPLVMTASDDDEEERAVANAQCWSSKTRCQYGYYANPYYFHHANDWMRRIRQETVTLYSSVWTWLPPPPPPAERWSLQEQCHILRAPNVQCLCQTILLKNIRCQYHDHNANASDDDHHIMPYPDYVVVVFPCTSRLDMPKLVEAIREARASSCLLHGPHLLEEKKSEHADNNDNVFDLELASLQQQAELTGMYSINSMSPFGLRIPQSQHQRQRLPILFVLASDVVPLGRLWVDSGHAQLKLGMTVPDFCRCLHPLITQNILVTPPQERMQKQHLIRPVSSTSAEEKKIDDDDDHAQHDIKHAAKVQCSFGAPTMRTTTKASSSSMTPDQLFDKLNAIASIEEIVHASIVAHTTATPTETKNCNDSMDLQRSDSVTAATTDTTMRTTTTHAHVRVPSMSNTTARKPSMITSQLFDELNAIASIEATVRDSIVARTATTHSYVGTAVANSNDVCKEGSEHNSNDCCADDSSCPRPLENGERNDNDNTVHHIGTAKSDTLMMSAVEKHNNDSDPQETPAANNEMPAPVVWLEEDDDDNNESTHYSSLALEVEIVRAPFKGRHHDQQYDDLIIAATATTTPMGAVVVVPGSQSDDYDDGDDSILRHCNSLALADVSMDFTEALTEIMDDEPETNHGFYHPHNRTTAKRGCWCAWLLSPKATKRSAVEWKTATTTASPSLRPSRSNFSMLTQEL